MQPTLYFRKKLATVIKMSDFFLKMYCGLSLLYNIYILYNINDKDTTNIVSLQMNVGFNTYLILNYMASTIHLLEKFV
jgi:hypothetical protein